MAQPVNISTPQMLMKIAMLQLECDERARREDELRAEIETLKEKLDVAHEQHGPDA